MVHIINYPAAYIEYLEYYHGSRDYFECHEVLEEYWKEHPDSPYRETWVGLIQLAVAMYHQRRGNGKGAVKMLASAIRMQNNDDLEKLGIDSVELKTRMQARLSQLEINSDIIFNDINIPFIDVELDQQMTKMRTDDKVIDPYILNKHTLRDRSEVIRTRQLEWERRNSV